MSDETEAQAADEGAFDAEAAFLASFDEEEKKEPAEAGAEAKATEESSEPDPDDAEVEWKRGEEPTKAKLRDLKAAYESRERATQDSAKATEVRARAEQDGLRAQTALKAMLDRANERWKPYGELDFLVLAQQVDADTLATIRKDAQAALNDVKFLTQELDGHAQAQQQHTQQQRQVAVQEAIKVLSDPATGIPNWGPDIYRSIIDHSASTGAPREVLHQITDPWAIKMLHKAMLFDQSAAKAAAKVEKVVHKATTTIKPNGSAGASKDATGRSQAMSALRKSGSMDAATDAFLASFAA